MRTHKQYRMPQWAARILHTPLAIRPEKLEAILSVLGPRIVAGLELDPKLVEPGQMAAADKGRDRKPYIVKNRIAIIDVFGSLVHRASWMDAWSGISSYEQIGAEFDQALDDTDVDGIMLIVDSPGGEVAGAFDFADRVFEARSRKAVVAVAEDMACSAAYLIGSAAGELYTTQTGMIGSIGVVLAHVDWTAANQAAGIKVTEIHAGARKVDCSPNQVLTEDKLSALQAHVGSFFDLFVEKVARNRGISEDAVRSQEAGVFIGAQAVEQGLADGVLSAVEVHSRMGVQVGTGMPPPITQAMGANARNVKFFDGEGQPMQAGENLGNLLDEAIQEQVTDNKSREDVISDMADAADTDVATVSQIVSGEIACPTVEALEGFAEVLAPTVDEMIDAATQDGCTYERRTEPDPIDETDQDAGEGGDPEAMNTAPRIGGAAQTKGGAMNDPKGSAAALKAERDEALAELEREKAMRAVAEDSLKAVEEQRKSDVIKRHQADGRVVPSMLATVDRVAATSTPEQLDEFLAGLPQVANLPSTDAVDGPGGVELDPVLMTEQGQKICQDLGVSAERQKKFGAARRLSIVQGTMQLETGETVPLPN